MTHRSSSPALSSTPSHTSHQRAGDEYAYQHVDDTHLDAKLSVPSSQPQQPKTATLWLYSLLGLVTLMLLMVAIHHIADGQIAQNQSIIDTTEELTTRMDTLTIELGQLALLVQDTQAEDDRAALIPALISQIEDNTNHIDTLLSQLTSGGWVQNRDGERMSMAALDEASDLQALANLTLTWQRQQSLLRPVLATDGNVTVANDNNDNNNNDNGDDKKDDKNATQTALPVNDVLAVANFAYLNRQPMTHTLHQLTQKHSQQSAYWASVVGKAPLIGFLLLVAYALWLAMYLSRLIKRSHAKLAQTARLNNELFFGAYDGLFFLDDEGHITERQSPTLTSIMGVDRLSHRRFLSLLERRIPKADHERAKDFISEIYQGVLTNDDISAKNPLKSVSFIGQNNAGMSSRQLSFSFTLLKFTSSPQSHLFSTQADEHLLVRVRPVNNNASALTNNGTDTDKLELLPQLLAIDNARLPAFIKRMDIRLSMLSQGLNDLLDIEADDAHAKPATKDTTKTKTKNASPTSSHIDFLLRTVHSMLVDANATPLPHYAQAATQLVNRIQPLSAKQNLPSSVKNDAFAAVLHEVEQLTLLQQEAHQLLQRLPNGSLPSQPAQHPALADKSLLLTLANDLKTDSHAATVSSLTQFVANEVKTQHKQVHLHCPTWHETGLNDTQRCMIYDISLQLLSNAICHGIEPVNERIDAGKTAYGQIRIHLTKTDTANGHTYELQCADDGGGIDFEKLVQAAVAQGLVDQKNAKKLSSEQIMKLLFLPKLYHQSANNKGSDSKDNGGKDSNGKDNGGKDSGMGMQLIKHHVKALNARLFIDSQQPNYSKFRIEFTV